MTATSKEALVTLRRMARGHAGASSGELAAWEILANLRDGAEVDFAEISCGWIAAGSGRLCSYSLISRPVGPG
jgi:hypothetical protein